MAKARTIFVCRVCQAQQSRWLGKCPECDSWDSLVEQILSPERPGTARRSSETQQPTRLRDISTVDFQRLPTGSEELARVLGGGIVPGSVILIGGDPGIGKTTLLSQVAAFVAEQVGPTLYVSAEESAQQIKLRAERLGLAADELYLLSETSLEAILQQIRTMRPTLAIIDSIQTVYLPDVSGAAGSVSQVREGALRLMQLAKESAIPIVLVGHVTKEGAIAGPRVLEHIVDAVLYLEGERFHQFRLLRGVKNRFGSTNEVGVFAMNGDGLRDVINPSQLFLAERSSASPGSTVAVTMEGSRPLLVELQALTAQSGAAQPRRTCNGFDMNRLLMLTAVLAKRVGLPLFNQDIYVNVVGGLRISEPAADLALAVAIASAFRNSVIASDIVCLGEIGLSGEIRNVSHLERRLSEAQKLGFRRAFVPAGAAVHAPAGMQLIAVRSVADAVDQLAGRRAGRTAPDDESDE
jgi:DNA repair protein RadA/Sms